MRRAYGAFACRGLTPRLRNVAAALSAAVLCACVSSPAPPATGAHSPPPPAVPTETPDASYDWHVLILVPFGTLFKESPIALHDVMQFHDVGAGHPAAGEPGAGQPAAGVPGAAQPGAGQQAAADPAAGVPGAGQPAAGVPASGAPGTSHSGASRPGTGPASSNGTEDKDCYGIDVAPPQFVGRRPHEYLLCFDHDRLTRIEATVRLPAQTAGSIFAAACARWRAAVAETEVSCDGRDGATGFSAHLSGEPALSISLFSVAAP
jgi:hypothetical protein